jgi:hypothetical protein
VIPEPPVPDAEAIAAEIKALRKGRGLRGDVARRIGPLLLELAGGDSVQVRGRLADELSTLSGHLPGQLRTAVLAALGLHPATMEMATYDRRKIWVATQFDRVPRTAERRIEEAQVLLAQEVAAELLRRRRQSDADDDGWHVEWLSVVLLLDGPTPEVIERRRIVATRDDLKDITIALDVPRDAGQSRLNLATRVTEGGTLVRTEEPSRNRTRFHVDLPHSLRQGEAHEYEMAIQVLPGEPMRPYYVCVPERRCDRFDLRVRFDRRRPPAWVRRVVGEDLRVYESFEGVPPIAGQVPVDGTGEATASFSQLRLRQGYGLQWLFPLDEPSAAEGRLGTASPDDGAW